MRRPSGQLGVSLIQLLIGTAVGLSLAAGLSTFFIQGSRSSREDINVAKMLNELGYAAGQVTQDLEMAGFWAQVHDPTGIDKDGTLALTVNAQSPDCGTSNWYQDLRPLELLDNYAAADIHAAYPCIATSDVVSGSDVIAVKRVLGRVAGTDTASTDMHAGTLYLRTHERYGRLYLEGAGTPTAVDTPYQNWEYTPVIYYVSPNAAPGVPGLCRMRLKSTGGAAPAFTRECIAQGIEQLQLEIGVDSDEDGGANYFTPAPSQADLNRACTARLYLLARSPQKEVDYVNPKTYLIGNMPASAPIPAPSAPESAKHYHRKTLSTEVALRNPRALFGVAVQ